MDQTLTIIIPTFNTALYIEKCFNSLVVDNLYFIKKYQIEVLFVNDGSTDESQQMIDNIKQKYNFVSSIYQENQGLSVVRNNAIKHIKTDFFILLDSDDWLNMSEFEKVYQKILNKKLDFISFGLNYYDQYGNLTGQRANQLVKYNQVNSGLEFLKQGYQPSSACLFIYNRNFIVSNDLWYYQGVSQQDVEQTLRLMLRAERGYFVEDKVYNYFRRAGSTTLPKTPEKLKKYLHDSIIVAFQMSKNKVHNSTKDVAKVIEQNYNSVTWNLLWRFIYKSNEVDYNFKLECLKLLKEKKLYPIKGALKSNFQRLTTIFFNQSFIIKILFKR